MDDLCQQTWLCIVQQATRYADPLQRKSWRTLALACRFAPQLELCIALEELHSRNLGMQVDGKSSYSVSQVKKKETVTDTRLHMH